MSAPHTPKLTIGEMRRLFTLVYILVTFGKVALRRQPSAAAAAIIIDTPWLDLADRLYHIKEFFEAYNTRQHGAFTLSRRQQIELVVACHKQVLTNVPAALDFRSRADAPAHLKPYVA